MNYNDNYFVYPQINSIYYSPIKPQIYEFLEEADQYPSSSSSSSSQLQQQQPKPQLQSYPFCKLNIKDLFHSFCNDPIHLDDYWLDFDRRCHLGRDMYKEFFYDGDEGHQRYHFDLNHGYETFDERLQRPLDEGLASICKYLLLKFSSTRPGITLREAVQFADFACFRGTLQKFAATFFEAQRPHKDRGWKFLIVKLQGVFFIQELETDARQEERIQETAYEKLATYWGLKFERYILAENGKRYKLDVCYSSLIKN
uniref:Decapping nuclease n=1 Tax=Panagrolaimus sp. ES5 TaxID=591445 RepID=A0AC34GBB5_9BILA